jgi:hypothetical protein
MWPLAASAGTASASIPELSGMNTPFHLSPSLSVNGLNDLVVVGYVIVLTTEPPPAWSSAANAALTPRPYGEAGARTANSLTPLASARRARTRARCTAGCHMWNT